MILIAEYEIDKVSENQLIKDGGEYIKQAHIELLFDEISKTLAKTYGDGELQITSTHPHNNRYQLTFTCLSKSETHAILDKLNSIRSKIGYSQEISDIIKIIYGDDVISDKERIKELEEKVQRLQKENSEYRYQSWEKHND